MAVEVEVKAWLDDLEETKRQVELIAEFAAEEKKEDVYFHIYSGFAEENRNTPREFRIRRVDNSVTLTWKVKKVVDNMEENEEGEMLLSDYAAALDFVRFLGAREYMKKRKETLSYKKGNLLIELNRVAFLGDFIEIERILPRSDPEKIAEAREEIMKILGMLNIPKEKIEKRFYTEMLREKNNGTA